MEKKKIGIAGIGYVGGALSSYFQKRNDCEVFQYDKFKKIGTAEELNKAHYVFLCLPTPFNKDKNYLDFSALEEVIGQLKGDKVIVIKSTLMPGVTEDLQAKFSNHVGHVCVSV